MEQVERTFRLMDANRDGLLNFKELVQILDAICKGGHETKLKIFYCLHLPGIVLPGFYFYFLVFFCPPNVTEAPGFEPPTSTNWGEHAFSRFRVFKNFFIISLPPKVSTIFCLPSLLNISVAPGFELITSIQRGEQATSAQSLTFLPRSTLVVWPAVKNSQPN